MPHGFAPTKSGAHRVICQSLYRNLLSACSRFPSPEAHTSESQLANHLKSLVRYRFRHDRSLQSPYRTRDALEFGREALKLLHDASTGEPQALKRLTSVLSSTHEQTQAALKAREKIKGNIIAERAPKNAEDSSTNPYPQLHSHHPKPATPPIPPRPRIPILSRPVPLSSLNPNPKLNPRSPPDRQGPKRYVPHYIVAHGVPFLRYGKPQPYGVSRMIRNIVAKRDRRWAFKAEMDKMADLAKWEDKWDREIERRFGGLEMREDEDERTEVEEEEVREGQDVDLNGHGASRANGDHVSWTRIFRHAEAEVMKKLKAQDKLMFERGKVFWDIYVKEREMARREQHEAKMQRRRRRDESAAADSLAVSNTPEVVDVVAPGDVSSDPLR